MLHMLLFALLGSSVHAHFHPNPFAAATSNSTTYDVAVGKSEYTFEPSVLYAAKGDIINFHFYPTNNSVVQSTFDKPCQPLSGGIDQKPLYSGFEFETTKDVAKTMYSIELKTTDPIWLYSSAETKDQKSNHCQKGQVMVINPLNATGQTLHAYIEAAKHVDVARSPTSTFGGLLMKDNGASPNVTAMGKSVGATETKKSGAAERIIVGTMGDWTTLVGLVLAFMVMVGM